MSAYGYTCVYICIYIYIYMPVLEARALAVVARAAEAKVSRLRLTYA